MAQQARKRVRLQEAVAENEENVSSSANVDAANAEAVGEENELNFIPLAKLSVSITRQPCLYRLRQLESNFRLTVSLMRI